MKALFANYRYIGRNLNNLGDHVQILTVDHLYKNMGIPDQEIIYIDKDDLSSYNGEPVLLPVSMPLIDYKVHGLAGMFSDKITPVFFGLTMAKDELLPEEADYLKTHEPVGCRDERTYETLVNSGVSAYLGGCLTVTLPKRKYKPEKQNKVFIIDPTKGLKDYLPDEVKKDAVWDTHLIYSRLENPVKTAEERYRKYCDEAKLMVTSLLHASVPCMAMGIPVVLAKDYVSYRFGWLESLLKIYTPPEYAAINWNPAVTEYESHKKLVKDLFFKRMNRQNDSFAIAQIHDFYMNRKRNEYVNDAFMAIQEFIDNTWHDYEKVYKYAVWGLTQMSSLLVSYIGRRYPNAELTHVYDLKTGLRFCEKGINIQAVHPENIALYPDETVFVTTVSAVDSAKKLFEKIDKPAHMYKILDVIV